MSSLVLTGHWLYRANIIYINNRLSTVVKTGPVPFTSFTTRRIL